MSVNTTLQVLKPTKIISCNLFKKETLAPTRKENIKLNPTSPHVHDKCLNVTHLAPQFKFINISMILFIVFWQVPYTWHENRIKVVVMEAKGKRNK